MSKIISRVGKRQSQNRDCIQGVKKAMKTGFIPVMLFLPQCITEFDIVCLQGNQHDKYRSHDWLFSFFLWQGGKNLPFFFLFFPCNLVNHSRVPTRNRNEIEMFQFRDIRHLRGSAPKFARQIKFINSTCLGNLSRDKHVFIEFLFP